MSNYTSIFVFTQVTLLLLFSIFSTLTHVTNASNIDLTNSSFPHVSNVSEIGSYHNSNDSVPMRNDSINSMVNDVQNLKNTSNTLQSQIESKDASAKLYNSTINSVVQVNSYENNNQSNSKEGSGFISDINGTVSLLTSNNLVNINDNVTITLSDGDIYESNLLGQDPVTNIAMLSLEQVPKDKIVPLPLANSTDISVGQEIALIDSLQGYSNLLSIGVISGIEKSIPTFGPNVSNTLTKIPNGIITAMDSHSMGYGGGPILDMKGQVVGMKVQNHSSEGQYVSPLTFVIPSNSINKVVSKLHSQGYYLHPWLGVGGTDVTPDIANILKLDEIRGFLVISVTDKSPADLAGILGGDNHTAINGRPITLGGDIILKVDDTDIKNIHEILTYIENEKNVGDDMLITVLRNGILQTINVVLEPNPDYIPKSN